MQPLHSTCPKIGCFWSAASSRSCSLYLETGRFFGCHYSRGKNHDRCPRQQHQHPVPPCLVLRCRRAQPHTGMSDEKAISFGCAIAFSCTVVSTTTHSRSLVSIALLATLGGVENFSPPPRCRAHSGQILSMPPPAATHFPVSPSVSIELWNV